MATGFFNGLAKFDLRGPQRVALWQEEVNKHRNQFNGIGQTGFDVVMGPVAKPSDDKVWQLTSDPLLISLNQYKFEGRAATSPNNLKPVLIFPV